MMACPSDRSECGQESAVAAADREVQGALRLFHAGDPSEAAANFLRIANWLGVSAESVEVGPRSCRAEIQAASVAGTGALVLDLESLSGLLESAEWESIARSLGTAPDNVLILGTHGSHLHAPVLEKLSEGAVTGIQSAGRPQMVYFPLQQGSWSAELGGHSYARSQRETLSLEVHPGGDAEVVMGFGQEGPSFVSMRRGAAKVFFWSTATVFDIDQFLEKELEFEQALDEYIPAIIFLRAAFGERCWHSPFLGADVMIDDPLLTRRYGLVDFKKLLTLAEDLMFHITVAFIPWNHWRTRTGSVRLFLDHPKVFGICAHGCDHTRNEFRTADYDKMVRKSILAADRLDRHQQRTGMVWDPLMVCPREDYTVEALQAFADSGRFLGLVNSGCIPRDMEAKRVRGVDLLQPAQDALFGFPIFKRYYWTDISVFAMAAFLGKPMILVEHHDFFKDQHRTLKLFLEQVSAICPKMRWSGPKDLGRRTCRLRRKNAKTLEAHFFTDEFLLENPDPAPRKVHFLRRVPEAQIDSVEINGMPASFTRSGEYVCFEAELAANGSAMVGVRRRRPPAAGVRPVENWACDVRVAARRLLSELRDDWLSRSPATLRLANRLMQTFRLRKSK